ncbi:MAG: hypothetical protein H5U40_06070 [Polyangiaceae bacterium]|nr:hypothetical protein [Polyangiaceae bacterium]
MALGIVLFVYAPAARAEEVPSPTDIAPSATVEPESAAGPSPIAAMLLQPAPVDVAGFPPVPRATPDTRGPGVELHGFMSAWWTPWSEASPTAAQDAFRLRFALLRVDARPAERISVIARLGLMLPGSPLLDFAATYTPHDAVGVTVGQFRLPIGASATTLAPLLVMLDRPTYVYAMTKLAFRDIGAMVHSGPRGIANGVFHYRLAMAGGGGRLGSGVNQAPGAIGEFLFAGRVLFDAGRLFLNGASDRLVFGATYVRSHDPAIDTGTVSRDRELAANVLGRVLVPFGSERVTQLAGGDVTLSLAGWWAQAEMLYLHSRATDGSVQSESLGSSLEVGYTLPVRLWNRAGLQIASRGERFDPNLEAKLDTLYVASLGFNVLTQNVRGGIFGTATFFDDDSGANRRAGEITMRLVTTF